MGKNFFIEEAYGPQTGEMRFLFSHHNLQMKYQTRDPKVILNGRLQVLKRYGYDPAERQLTPQERELALILDYTEALLATYRVRAQLPAFAITFGDSMSVEWDESDFKGAGTDPRAMARMLTNFCRDIELSRLLLPSPREAWLPDFLKKWCEKVKAEMEHDHQFYICWRRHILLDIGGAEASGN
ncbi:hypothetical protein [uncultured Flavonifractor sp.]|uniref:hypothetical protein n=1 Tax=uncultured Flavonifractor sp. TaxID=1193534 RepID=UPI0025928873|nr:hypothetical protein [uncultured Flavonifractor sp.]